MFFRTFASVERIAQNEAMKSEGKNSINKVVSYWKWGLSLFLGIGIFCWWGLIKPHILSYEEQYQLFLCSVDYFQERLSVPGGLAEWLGEFIVQFYTIPFLGALLLALVYLLLQRLIASFLSSESYLISFIPTILLFWFMGDSEVLLSFPIAIILALLVAKIRIERCWKACAFEIVAIPLLYWLAGPTAWLYVAMRFCQNYRRYCWTPLWFLALPVALWYTSFDQWPLQSLLLSMGYYRKPVIYPFWLWLIPLAVWLTVVFDKFKGYRVVKLPVQVVVLLALCWFAKGDNSEKEELIWQDCQIRHEAWDKVIKRAGEKTVNTVFWSNSVNLALAETRQLADRMFEFYQSGIDALLMNMVRDPFSNLPAAEAFYRLGMVNSAQRYMFDMQESIYNGRKSGRFTQRIAECYIINGKYDLARKHLALLKQSLFYRSWAEDAETYLGDEAKIDAHPVWGKLRQLRLKDDYLFYYPEMAAMLGSLFNGNRNNTLALDYFVAQLLLNGDAPSFQHALPWVQQYGGYREMPRGYRDVMTCIQNQGNVPGSPYAAFIRRMLDTANKQQNSNHDESAH